MGSNGALAGDQDLNSSKDFVEELSEEYNVDVEINEKDEFSTLGETSEEIPEISAEELEETFQFLEYMKENDVVFEGVSANEFSTMNTTSGTATASSSSTTGPQLNDNIINTNISFNYVVEESSVSGGLATFQSVTNLNSFHSGASWVDWIENNTASNIVSAGTLAELSASGYWEVNAAYDGLEVGVIQQDDWRIDYSSRNLN